MGTATLTKTNQREIWPSQKYTLPDYTHLTNRQGKENSMTSSALHTCRVTVDVIKPNAYSPTRGWRIIATSLKAVVFWSVKKDFSNI